MAMVEWEERSECNRVEEMLEAGGALGSSVLKRGRESVSLSESGR